jgi:foldase protein PrsA
MEEARVLAEELFERAKSGEDFDALVKEYTDDSHPGIYKMSNFGIPADEANGVYARDRMVAAFGDVGFPLKVGEIGLASYDPQKSKYGWHIIKRLE